MEKLHIVVVHNCPEGDFVSFHLNALEVVKYTKDQNKHSDRFLGPSIFSMFLGINPGDIEL